jgi:hypothetical protein
VDGNIFNSKGVHVGVVRATRSLAHGAGEQVGSDMEGVLLIHGITVQN